MASPSLNTVNTSLRKDAIEEALRALGAYAWECATHWQMTDRLDYNLTTRLNNLRDAEIAEPALKRGGPAGGGCVLAARAKLGSAADRAEAEMRRAAQDFLELAREAGREGWPAPAEAWQLCAGRLHELMELYAAPY